MNRKRRKLKHIGDLPQEKQIEIFEYLQDHTYNETIALLQQPAPEGIGQKVSRSTLEVHYARCCEDQEIENLPEIKESADAWLHYKETGETGRFDEAALERLKLRTFQLSETLKDQKELTQLKSLFGILFAARLAEVRERTVAVRERLATVRENGARTPSSAAIPHTKGTPLTTPNAPLPGTRTPSSAALPNAQGTPLTTATTTPNLENIEEPENPTARVVKACGGVPEFFGMIRPGERITHAIRRMWYEIEAGTFVPPPPTPETITPPGVPVGPNGEIKPEEPTPCSVGVPPAGSRGVPPRPQTESQPQPQP